MRVLLLLLLLTVVYPLYADFIIPRSDPVYPFLEMTHNLRQSHLNHFLYPLYYNDIMAVLYAMKNDSSAGFHSTQARFHYTRLRMDYSQRVESGVYPPSKIPSSVGNLFRSDPTHHRLVTITDPRRRKNTFLPMFSAKRNDTYIYVSGMLGFEYDVRMEKVASGDMQHRYRHRKYYGIETAGNFTQNFGFFLMFRKGHYLGNEPFIRENPFLTKDGDQIWNDDGRFYQVDMISEIDFKNPYLNISMGYGSFDIGRTISSSVILNSDVTPYGYFKFHKKFGWLDYNGITAQLIPDDMSSQSIFRPKSMAIQTISLHTQPFSIGVGNGIVYGDRSFDIAYSTPLAIYKIMDNKYHARDNGVAFLYAETRPMSGINIYANILFDDIRNSRFTSPEWMSFSAYQGGLICQLRKIPLEVAGEVTAVGPSTYSHKDPSLTYMHDDMLLGHRHGSNFLSFATRMRYHFTRMSLGFFYENMQQGDIAYHPTNGEHDQVFLANNISRYEFFGANLDLRLIPELHLHTRYEYRKRAGKEIHYVFSGVELKY